MEGKRGSECLLKSVSNIDFNPDCGIEKCWNKVTELLSLNEDITIKYLEDCDADGLILDQ